MADALLVLNAGSSSLKFSVFLDGDPPPTALAGQARRASRPDRASLRARARPWLRRRNGRPARTWAHEEAIEYLFSWGRDGALGEHRIVAVGHRVVHGGMRFSNPILVDETAHRARSPGSARAAAPASQPGGHQGCLETRARAATGCLLRYRVSPDATCTSHRRSLCLAATPRKESAATAFTDCPTSTSPRCSRRPSPALPPAARSSPTSATVPACARSWKDEASPPP